MMGRMRDLSRRRTWVHGTALLTVALVVVAVAVAPWEGAGPAPGHTTAWLAQLFGALTFGYVGAVIADRTRPPVTVVGAVLQVPGLTQAATLLTSSLLYRASTDHADLPVVGWLDGWLWAPGLLCVLTVLPLVYPGGAALPRLRPALFAGVTVTVLGTAVVAGQALPGDAVPPWLTSGLVVAVAACVVCGVISLAVRVRRGDARTRGQVAWLAGAVVVIVAFEPLQTALPRPVATAGLAFLPLLVPVAVGVAVLRHGLYDIDLLVTRTLAYVLLVAVLVALYLAVVVAASHEVAGGAVQVPALVAAVAVALIADPVRARIQRVVRWWLLGASAEPQRLLADLAQQLGSSPSLRHAPQTVVDTVAAAFRAPYVELLATPDDGPPTVVARAGTEVAGHSVTTPVEYGGRVVGALCTGRDQPAEPRELRALAHVATALGPVLDGWLVTAELQRSRERVVAARESERSRLHRDLHDGLGPTLGGITLAAHAAHNLVRSDLPAAEKVLMRLSELAGQATAEVRRVVDGLRPSALESHGLVEAIRREVHVVDGYPVVHVTNDPLADLPPAVEVAAMRIVLEAVTNVRRHANARRCEVRLGLDGQVLTVIVDDDGSGTPAADRGGRGVGLESMAHRASELGGVCRLGVSPLGGTRVLARLPVGERA